jgi:hypothetical protein
MSFPGARPSYQGFTSSHTLAVDNHAAQHNQEQADISALSDKIGTGSSTPSSNLFLRGTDVGISAWGQVNLPTDVTGALPVANGGTGGATPATARANLGVNTLAELLPSIYPIGCIYTEITGTNPATTFGFGVWSQFGQGQVLAGQKTTDTNFDTVLKTGGESTHTLTAAEQASMPVKTTDFVNLGSAGALGGFDVNADTTNTGTDRVSAIGGGGAHNNLQPYIVVYFWRRTS